MSTEDLLTQDEIDALLHGVSSGDVETDAGDYQEHKEAIAYDFTSQDRIVRGRLPALEMINERFSRALKNSLFVLLRREPEVSFKRVQMIKYSEYINSLFVPASINVVKMKPLKGNALVIFDPTLIFLMVDNYFGGGGRFQTKMEGRDFTLAEQRVISRLLDTTFANIKEAWKPVMALDPEFIATETNPHFANVTDASEPVVVTTVSVALEGGGGEIHVTMPYTMIEPVKDKLDSNIQRERSDVDQRWTAILQEEIKNAKVGISAVLVETELKLRDVNDLKPGDVIPVDLPATAPVFVEGIALFKGRFGISNGHNAVKLTGRIGRD